MQNLNIRTPTNREFHIVTKKKRRDSFENKSKF